ncbi:MAG: hypothetical protein ACE5E7_11435 [Anaerolineae bacterium]
MREPEGVYLAYMLRLWRAEQDGRPVWRASVESPYTGERQGFSDLGQFIQFLEEITAEPSDPDIETFNNRSKLE